jgi:hypothetical protein
VERALAAGDALTDDFGVFVDKDGHGASLGLYHSVIRNLLDGCIMA